MKSWTNWLVNTTNKGVHEFFTYAFLNISIHFLVFLDLDSAIGSRIKILVSAVMKHILNERLVPF